MPVYEQSYRHWEGVLNEHAHTWLVIARNGIRLLWRRWMIILVILAYIPFVVRVAQIYLVSGFGFSINQLGKEAAKYLQVDPFFFENFIHGQSFFIILVILLAGSGLIAIDKKHNALQLYFSKPLTKWEYLSGKFAILSFYIGLVSFLPAFLLFSIRILVADNLDFLRQNYWILFSISGYFILMVIVLGGLMLALSSLGKSPRFAGIGFFAVLGISDIIKKIFSSIPEAGAISLIADIKQIADVLFHQPPTQNFSIWLAVVALCIAVILFFIILTYQIRGTEVVK